MLVSRAAAMETKARKLFRLCRSPLFLRALRHGVAATIEHESALERLSPSTILDIGANKGQFATLCRQLFPQARVIAFEPLAEPADTLEKLFAGDSQVSLIRAAVGGAEEERTMFVSARVDSSSLLDITDQQVQLFPGTARAGTCTVRVAPLDHLIDVETLTNPILLKVDVQGAELEVLRACDPILDVVAAVYVETSFIELYAGQAFADDIIHHLQTRGFRMDGLFNPTVTRERGVVQADFLFLRDSASTPTAQPTVRTDT